MYAACLVFLAAYSGMSDLSVGSPCMPNVAGTEHAIGFFVNTVVLRMAVHGHQTLRELVRKANVLLHGAIAHADLPFQKIVEAVQPVRQPDRTPLFQFNFRSVHQARPALSLVGMEALPAEYVDNGTAKFDLALDIETFTGQSCYFEYATDLFGHRTIARMECDFLSILCELIQAPDTAFRELPAVIQIARRRTEADEFTEERRTNSDRMGD